MIKTWNERCEDHPDHQTGMVSSAMIQARMQEEIDALRTALEQQAEPWGWYSAKADDFMTHSIRKEHERLGSYTHINGKFDLPLYTHPAVGSQTQGEEQ